MYDAFYRAAEAAFCRKKKNFSGLNINPLISGGVRTGALSFFRPRTFYLLDKQYE
jgi:hypothetical protein